MFCPHKNHPFVGQVGWSGLSRAPFCEASGSERIRRLFRGVCSQEAMPGQSCAGGARTLRTRGEKNDLLHGQLTGRASAGDQRTASRCIGKRSRQAGRRSVNDSRRFAFLFFSAPRKDWVRTAPVLHPSPVMQGGWPSLRDWSSFLAEIPERRFRVPPARERICRFAFLFFSVPASE